MASIIIGGILLLLYLEDPYIGKMAIFSTIFVIAFLLVAKYHHKQLTIIFIACAIALLLGDLLMDHFHWEQALEFVEWEVLTVVFGMSLLVESTTETGIFDWIVIWSLKISKGTIFLLFTLTFLITFFLSSILANVTAMLLVGSMTITVCRVLDYDPTPFLMTSVLATALAGMSTLVSSLPAIMVGTAAEIGFLEFLLISLPFVTVSMPICIFYIVKFYPEERIVLGEATQSIDPDTILGLNPWDVIDDKQTFYLAAAALIITVIGFILADPLGIPIGVMAILCGILSMILTGVDEQELMKKINWDTILFFAGLFILVGILEETELLLEIAIVLKEISSGDLFFTGTLILIITAVLSGVLDNIPVTATLVPIISNINQQHIATNPYYLWFILVFSGALGGGWTPLGSASGILAAGILANEDRPISFMNYMKLFIPISAFLAIFGQIYLTALSLFGII